MDKELDQVDPQSMVSVQVRKKRLQLDNNFHHVKQVEPTDKELDQVDPERMVSVQTRKKKLESEAFARAAAKRRLTAMNTAKKFESDLKAVRERNWIRCPLCWAPVSVILKKVPHLSLASHQHDCLVREALKNLNRQLPSQLLHGNVSGFKN